MHPLAMTGMAMQGNGLITKVIPSSGEHVPAIGMGTWITFNVGNIPFLLQERIAILNAFFEMGGTLIDSSPMYGSSEATLGHCFNKMPSDIPLFSATKTWTQSKTEGMEQFQNSTALWHRSSFDLLQVHNLVNWQSHLETLKELKSQKKIRYIGVTTSHGRRHSELARIMSNEDIDFVQLTYNVLDTEVEKDLLPLALEKGIAVIANRPFQGGRLPEIAKSTALPNFAKSLQCTSWPQLLLKYVISHPAITCAIPATSKVEHMKENIQALRHPLPTFEEREMIKQAFIS